MKQKEQWGLVPFLERHLGSFGLLARASASSLIEIVIVIFVIVIRTGIAVVVGAHGRSAPSLVGGRRVRATPALLGPTRGFQQRFL